MLSATFQRSSKSGLRFGLLVRNPVVGLEQQGRGQEARWDTQSPVGEAIEVGEVLVPKQLVALGGQQAVERVPPDVLQIRVINSQRPIVSQACPKQRMHPLAASRGVYPSPCLSEAFRPHF